MAENLGQTYDIVGVVLQELLGEGVLKKMGMESHANQGRIFSAKRLNACGRQTTSLTDEDVVRGHGRSGFKVQPSTLFVREVARHGSLFVSLGPPKTAVPLRSVIITSGMFQIHEVRYPGSGE